MWRGGFLHVEFFDVAGVSGYELLAGLHVITHEGADGVVCLEGIGDVYPEHGALFRVHGGFPELFRVHFAQPLVALHMHIALAVQLGQFPFFLVLGVAVLGALPVLHPVEGRLGYVEVFRLDKCRHATEEEGEQERPNMRAVHIGIGHDDDLVVSQFAEVEVFALASSQGRDQGPYLCVAQDAVRLPQHPLDVKDLAFHREDSLEATVASHFG